MKDTNRNKGERIYSWRDVTRISVGEGMNVNHNAKKQRTGAAREILYNMVSGYLAKMTEAQKKEFFKSSAIFFTIGDKKLLSLVCGVFSYVLDSLDAVDTEHTRLNNLIEAQYTRLISYLRDLPRANARKAAMASRHVTESRAIKAQALDLWRAWRRGDVHHRSAAAFSRHIIKVLPGIQNTKTVERWATQWLREAKTKK